MKRIISMLLVLVLIFSLVLTEGAIIAEATTNKSVTVAGYEYNISGGKVANLKGYEYIIPEEGKVLWEAYAPDDYLNARDPERKVVKQIDQGEKFWVFGVFTGNTNRVVIFHEGDFCTVYIPDIKATGNTLWYDGASYEATNHTKTNLRSHNYQLIRSVPAGQDMIVIGSSVYRPTRNVVICGKDIGTVQMLDMEVPSSNKTVSIAGYEYNISGGKVANLKGYEYIIPEEGQVLWEAYAPYDYLNARDPEGNFIKRIDQGENFWVFGVFTGNTNRVVIFHKGDFCTVYIPDIHATRNTLWYDGTSYETTNHTQTDLRSHNYRLIRSVPAGQDMIVIGSYVTRPTRNVVICGKDIGTVQMSDMEVPSYIKTLNVAGYTYNISGDKVANLKGYEYILPEGGNVLWEAYAPDDYLNARDPKGNVVKQIDQGEKFWVFGVFTGNTNRVFVFHEGDFCTVYIPDIKATGNTLRYEGASYETTNPTKTDLRSTNDQLIRSIPAGQDIIVIGSSMYWPARNIVICGKDIGTIQMLNIEVPDVPDVPEAPEVPDVPEVPSSRKFVRSTESWNLRERNGNRKVIQLVQAGEVFEEICQDPYDSRYIYVIWNGIEGTIFNDGFEEIQDVPEFRGESYHAYNSYKSGLNVRSKDYVNIIGNVPKNANFYVLGESVDNPKRVVIVWDGKIGTIMKEDSNGAKCITKIEDSVFINKPKQTVSLYRDGKFIGNSLCITGEEKMANKKTPTGVYSILKKQTQWYLKGTSWKGNEYNTLVNYWMPFVGGKGLHDATWCDTFGGNFYQDGGGSNGCVRLPLSFAQLVYDNVEVGTPVIIFSYKSSVEETSVSEVKMTLR